MKYKGKKRHAVRTSEMILLVRGRCVCGITKKLTCSTEDMERRFLHHTGSSVMPRQEHKKEKKLVQCFKMRSLMIV